MLNIQRDGIKIHKENSGYACQSVMPGQYNPIFGVIMDKYNPIPGVEMGFI